MTGPEHYRQAEKLLHEAATGDYGTDSVLLVAEAHVHATLALAAAFADPYGPDEHIWREALS